MPCNFEILWHKQLGNSKEVSQKSNKFKTKCQGTNTGGKNAGENCIAGQNAGRTKCQPVFEQCGAKSMPLFGRVGPNNSVVKWNTVHTT